MRRLRRFLIVLAVIAVLFWMFVPQPGPAVAQGSVLVFDIGGTYIEAADPPLLARLLGDRSRTFVSVLSELRKAERDDRLAGVLLRVRDLNIGWGKAQELRDAISDLRAAGRPTLAYLELSSLGANMEYYVASAAERVHANPGTASPLVGLAAEFFFLGGLWERIGAGVETESTGEYKSAAETLTGRDMSLPHREMARSLLDSADEQFVAGIAESRELDVKQVRAAIAAAPASPGELLALGLIDEIQPYDEAVAHLGRGPVVEDEDYAAVDPSSVGFAPVAQFALIYGSGSVVMGSGTVSPGGTPRLASDTVRGALLDASRDDDIDAIILRIDSPGGSPLAADIVWRAARRARERGKPLIVSVSDYAASGGYYVACAADTIYASPSSLVGSIGVIATRVAIGGLLEKLDIGVVSMTRGPYADLLVTSKPLSPQGRRRLREETDALYDLFVSRVADSRGLATERVDAVGRGRVWTGAQAVENGLVDGLGGLRAAVLRAKRDLGLAEEVDVALIPYPAPKSLTEQVNDALRRVVLQSVGGSGLSEVMSRVEPWLAAAPEGALALLPPYLVEIR